MRATPPQRDLQLQVVFVFMIVYAGLLFVVRPHPAPAQVAFRVGSALAGVAGLVHVARRQRGR